MLLSALTVIFVCVTADLAAVTADSDCEDRMCSHTCVEVAGKPTCTCPKDMTLDSDARTCREPVTLLLGMYRGIMMITDGKPSHDFLPILPLKATAIDFHYNRNEIFLYNNNTIFRYSLRPFKTSPPVSVTKTSTMVTSLAVDWVHDDVFWISDQKSAVEAVSIFGGNPRSISSHNDTESAANWHNLVVDPYVGKLFWLGSGGVCSSDLTGSDMHCELSWEGLQPEDIALDTIGQQIYVIGTHGNRKVVARSRYDGSQGKELLTIPQSGSKVFGFGVLGETLYWESNHDGENLYKCKLPSAPTGQQVAASLVEELNQIVYDMKIYHPDLQKPSK